eukprot:755974-Hanusia_phi.AAC.3
MSESNDSDSDILIPSSIRPTFRFAAAGPGWPLMLVQEERGVSHQDEPGGDGSGSQVLRKKEGAERLRNTIGSYEETTRSSARRGRWRLSCGSGWCELGDAAVESNVVASPSVTLSPES